MFDQRFFLFSDQHKTGQGQQERGSTQQLRCLALLLLGPGLKSVLLLIEFQNKMSKYSFKHSFKSLVFRGFAKFCIFICCKKFLQITMSPRGALWYIQNRNAQVTFLSLKLRKGHFRLAIRIVIFWVPSILNYFFGLQMQ